MKTVTLISCLVLIPAFSFTQEKWTNLFNGKDLKNWDTYVGPEYDSIKKDWGTKSLGLNTDPNKVFTVVMIDGAPALRVSGENFGGVSTLKEFADYHLRFQFKWGQAKSNPKKNDKRDSGLLYHAVGEHGADYKFWMRSQEFQIQEGDCGDYWGVAGGSFEITTRKTSSGDYIYDAKGERRIFNSKSEYGRHSIKNPENEKPTGEWNSCEIYCLGDVAIHVVNGKVVMMLTKSGQLDGDVVAPLTKGKIQIQSEGSEIFFRNIEIRSIKKLPALQ